GPDEPAARYLDPGSAGQHVKQYRDPFARIGGKERSIERVQRAAHDPDPLARGQFLVEADLAALASEILQALDETRRQGRGIGAETHDPVHANRPVDRPPLQTRGPQMNE